MRPKKLGGFSDRSSSRLNAVNESFSELSFLPFSFYLFPFSMRIWIDLANSPHVPFFRALIPEFVARGHQVEITVRDFAQTVELATKAGMMTHVIGGHGGGSITGKAGNLIGRAGALRKWGRDRGFDLAVSHNSYAQISAAATLRIKT